jgi:hypothetical protein
MVGCLLWLPVQLAMEESFCEHIISQANLVITDRNSLFNDKELEMLVILQMNREVIEYLRENYKDETHVVNSYTG